MAQASITKLESVIAGIRSYLSEQLGELDNELDAARKEVAELSEQLASRQASVEVLVAGRDLLVAKLGELDATVAVDELPATEPGPAAAETPPTAARTLNASQRDVLSFLESTTPGVHKVAEIATAVNGRDAGNAAVQAVRRALGVLTEAGLAVKSTQSGAAFYTATSVSPKVAQEAEASPQDVDAEEPAPAARTRTAASTKARSAETTSKTSAPKEAAAKKAAAKKTAKGESATSAPAASKPAASASRTARKSASAPVEKTVRADRTKIVATLLGSPEPRSAAEVSRTVMGSEWKSSDATNFRNVLKSMVAEGVVAEHVGENNRSRYTVAASS